MKAVVEIVHTFEVTVDETKFTDEFLEEFNSTMYYIEDIDGHIKNLACLAAYGNIDGSTNFVEGYGDLKEMGIKIEDENGYVSDYRRSED